MVHRMSRNCACSTTYLSVPDCTPCREKSASNCTTAILGSDVVVVGIGIEWGVSMPVAI
jgi:hypothetical protein